MSTRTGRNTKSSRNKLYRSRKKYDFPRKKSYKSRFRDSKINTNLEKKIAIIAKRLDAENFFYNYKLSVLSGGWLSSGEKDPNIPGLAITPATTIFAVGWGQNDAIPSQETAVGSVHRLDTGIGQRSSDEIFITSVTVKGFIWIDGTIIRNQNIIKMGLFSVKVPLSHQQTSPGTNFHTIVDYLQLCDPSVLTPANNMYYPVPLLENFKTQKLLSMKTINQRSNPATVPNASGAPSDAVGNTQINFKFTHRFKKPYRYRYNADDATGSLPIDSILWFGINTHHRQDVPARPQVYMNTRLQYYEK